MNNRFSKGYRNDGGTDIVMDREFNFPPNAMTVVELNVPVNPPKGYLAIVCPRSSFAKKGLFIANCPIDAEYEGEIKAIVFNSSECEIHCDVGESFCQFVVLRCLPNLYHVKPKMRGRRKCNGWGSTGL